MALRSEKSGKNTEKLSFASWLKDLREAYWPFISSFERIRKLDDRPVRCFVPGNVLLSKIGEVSNREPSFIDCRVV